MKKHIFTTLLWAGALLGVSCNKSDDGFKSGSGTVSRQAQQALKTKYPDAQNIEWTLRGNYAVADFSLSVVKSASSDGSRFTAWFENANGQWAMTETNIDFSVLPQAVQEGVKAGKYAESEGWTRTGKIDKLERRDVVMLGGGEGVIVVYVIGVSRTVDQLTTVMDLYFSDEGVLVNEVANPTDNGYEDYIPEQPTASVEEQVQAYLNENGGGRVIDIDREYGGTEVELVCGGYKHDLYFDEGNTRVYVKIEYGRRDIGTAVPEAIYDVVATDQQLSGRNEVEDIEKWILDEATADGIRVFWCVEAEAGHREVEVYVNDDPIQIISRPVIDMGGTGGNDLPVDIDIEQFLRSHYSGATVVERDYDDGCLELTIFHENLYKEVLFDGRNNWLRTEWETRQLPQNIQDAVNREGYTIDDNEFKCIETANGMWYEFEARKDRLEYELRVDADGNIEAYRD